MKKIYLSKVCIRSLKLIFLLLFLQLHIAAQDVPGYTFANVQTAPAGTIVIAMDNTNQANGGGRFNLKAYGLIVSLLHNQYPIRWVIRTGKIKDGIDFTVNTERVTPSFQSAASRAFRASAFLIYPSDTSGVYTRINAFNNSLAAADRVQTYRTTSAVNVDVRYNLNRMPRVAVLSDGGNQHIHLNYLIAASIPAANYFVFSATTLASDCFSFAAEPHLEAFGPWNAAARDFVTQGGNFLAQCHAINTYENMGYGFYQSTTGLKVVNARPGAVTYPDADMAYSQFHGAYNPRNGGSVRNWEFNVGSARVNNAYKVVGDATRSEFIGASVSKVGTGVGGLVFYLGNHEFLDLTSEEDINGIRMFLNAMMIPSGWSCNSFIWKMLPIKLNHFGLAEKSENHNKLQWFANEEGAESGWYTIEHSIDGKTYTSLKRVPAKNFGEQHYTFRHEQINSAKNFYRLRLEEVHGQISYSSPVQVINYAEKELNIYPNPASSFVNLSFPNRKNTRYSVQVMDMAGRQVKKLSGQTVDHVVYLPVSDLIPGTYVVSVRGSDGSEHHSKMVVDHKTSK